jgi:hypothetical protein
MDQLTAAFEDPQGLKALIQRVGTDKCQCAAKQCSGHGRCYGPTGESQKCACYAGFSGDSCSTRVEPGTERSTATEASIAVAPPQMSRVTKLRAGSNIGTICPDGVSACAAGQTCAQFSVGR